MSMSAAVAQRCSEKYFLQEISLNSQGKTSRGFSFSKITSNFPGKHLKGIKFRGCLILQFEDFLILQKFVSKFSDSNTFLRYLISHFASEDFKITLSYV